MNDAPEKSEKRMYQKPQLVVYGDIRAITQQTGMVKIIDNPTDNDSRCDRGSCMTA
jgi:hypothetical protein